MQVLNYTNLLLLVSLFVTIALFVAITFRLRTKLGIGVLFTGIGAFQFLQTYLANTILIEITSSFGVTPGTILFHASLFAVLLIFVKEDAAKARTLLSAILITNLFLSTIQYFIGISFPESPMAALFNSENVAIGIKTFSMGTVLLFIDGLLIFFLYSQTSKMSSSFITKAFITMSLVFIFDALIFHILIRGIEPTAIFLNSVFTRSILSSLVYSILFQLYFKIFEKSKLRTSTKYSLNTIFSFLLYRSKLENIQKKLAHQEKVFTNQIVTAENKFQIASEIANLSYWKFDKYSNAILLNDQLLKIYKTSFTSLGGYNISFKDFVDTFIPQDERDTFLKKVMAINFEQAPSRTEIMHKATFGNGEQGQMLTIIVTNKDTTDGHVEVDGITQIIR